MGLRLLGIGATANLGSVEFPELEVEVATSLGLAGSRGGSDTVRRVSELKASYRSGELAELLADAEPPTADDVSVTDDGRRLDTAEAVIAFFDEMRATRAYRSSSA